MQLKYLPILALTLLYGCTTEASVTQTPAKPAIAINTNTQNIKSGTFVAGEHDTSGSARIISENGKNYLELDADFKTSNLGPDLYVILHRSDDVLASTKPPAYPLKAGDYVVLSRLQNYSGAQRYAIASNIDLANYQSAVIWCRLFNATFGTAQLSNLESKK